MEVKATQKHILMSPRKLRIVAGLIKDMDPVTALQQLPFVGKRAAAPLGKVIGTAIANAKEKGISDSQLMFKEIQINEGPRLKRWRAGARGRAKPYKRRMSHIRVVLQTKAETEKKTGKPAKETKKESVRKTDKKSKVKVRKTTAKKGTK